MCSGPGGGTDCPGLPETVQVLTLKALGKLGLDYVGLMQLRLHAKITTLWRKKFMIGNEATTPTWEGQNTLTK